VLRRVFVGESSGHRSEVLGRLGVEGEETARLFALGCAGVGAQESDALLHLRAQLGRGTHQHGLRTTSVFLLCQQVRRHPFRASSMIGDDQHLTRPRQTVDPHHPEDLPLGLVDVGVARTTDDVHARNRGRAVGKCAHGLSPSQAIDLLYTQEVCGRQHRFVDRPIPARRSADGQLRHPGHLRRRHVHDYR